MAISETKGEGWKAAPPSEEGQLYINLNPNCLFVQQPPKKERDWEAYLNYYASTNNRGRQLSHRKKTKSNMTKSTHP